MKTIKTRNSVKNIKTLNRTANLSKYMKTTFVRTKASAEDAHNPHHASPTDYATDSVQDKAQRTANHLPRPRFKIRKNLDRAKGHFQKVKRNLPNERRRAAEQAENIAHRAKDSADSLRKAADQTQKAADQTQKAADQTQKAANKAKTAVRDAKQAFREVRQSGRYTLSGKSTVKSTNKGFKKTAKGTVKTAKRSVKTAERTAKQTVKTAQQTAKTAQKTAQAAAKAAKAAERTARAAALAAEKTAKVAVKTIAALVKITIAAIKGLIALIAAGGWVAVVVILIICLVALLVGSIFGIFFSSEPDPSTGQTVNTVIAEIDAEYTAKIDEIVSANTHDILDMSGARAAWKQVLAVYTVKTVSDPDNPMEVATMTDEKAGILRAVFWEMNTVTYILDEVEVEEDEFGDDGLPTGEKVKVFKTVLRITVTHKTADEIAAQYGFTDEQKEWLAELLNPEYNSLWNALLYGITSVGDGSMIEVAETQLGNVGGEPYWSWYGFSSREAWCACFVSWCAEQLGYIDAGIIPKFASCQDGIAWFKAKGQWQDSGGYVPATGDLIFFDWDGDGSSDHVGIVERVEGNTVHTIEGNTSDSVARRNYELDSEKVMGYGVPIFL